MMYNILLACSRQNTIVVIIIVLLYFLDSERNEEYIGSPISTINFFMIHIYRIFHNFICSY